MVINRTSLCSHPTSDLIKEEQSLSFGKEYLAKTATINNACVNSGATLPQNVTFANKEVTKELREENDPSAFAKELLAATPLALQTLAPSGTKLQKDMNFVKEELIYEKPEEKAESQSSVNTSEPITEIPSTNHLTNEELFTKLQEEVPELSEMLGRRADWLDAIYIYFELMKLNIEGKKQEQYWRSCERKLQLEQIEETVKNLEKTAKDQFNAGIMGGLTGILSGIVPMVGYTTIGEYGLGALQSSFSSFQGLKPVDAFDKLGKIIQSMSQMEQGMMEVRKTNAEADRHRLMQFSDITRSYCDDNTREKEALNQDFQGTLQAILQYLNQNREIVNSLYGG